MSYCRSQCTSSTYGKLTREVHTLICWRPTRLLAKGACIPGITKHSCQVVERKSLARCCTVPNGGARPQTSPRQPANKRAKLASLVLLVIAGLGAIRLACNLLTALQETSVTSAQALADAIVRHVSNFDPGGFLPGAADLGISDLSDGLELSSSGDEAVAGSDGVDEGGNGAGISGWGSGGSSEDAESEVAGVVGKLRRSGFEPDDVLKLLLAGLAAVGGVDPGVVAALTEIYTHFLAVWLGTKLARVVLGMISGLLRMQFSLLELLVDFQYAMAALRSCLVCLPGLVLLLRLPWLRSLLQRLQRGPVARWRRLRGAAAAGALALCGIKPGADRQHTTRPEHHQEPQGAQQQQSAQLSQQQQVLHLPCDGDHQEVQNRRMREENDEQATGTAAVHGSKDEVHGWGSRAPGSCCVEPAGGGGGGSSVAAVPGRAADGEVGSSGGGYGVAHERRGVWEPGGQVGTLAGAAEALRLPESSPRAVDASTAAASALGGGRGRPEPESSTSTANRVVEAEAATSSQLAVNVLRCAALLGVATAITAPLSFSVGPWALWAADIVLTLATTAGAVLLFIEVWFYGGRRHLLGDRARSTLGFAALLLIARTGLEIAVDLSKNRYAMAARLLWYATIACFNCLGAVDTAMDAYYHLYCIVLPFISAAAAMMLK